MPKENESKLKKYSIYASAISASLAILYGIAEAGIKLDERYMKSENYHEVLDERYLVLAEYESREKAREIRVLEDKIFELQMKIESGTGTAVDRAMLARYRDRLNGLRAK
jgi:hypothetical protein